MSEPTVTQVVLEKYRYDENGVREDSPYETLVIDQNDQMTVLHRDEEGV